MGHCHSFCHHWTSQLKSSRWAATVLTAEIKMVCSNFSAGYLEMWSVESTRLLSTVLLDFIGMARFRHTYLSFVCACPGLKNTTLNPAGWDPFAWDLFLLIIFNCLDRTTTWRFQLRYFYFALQETFYFKGKMYFPYFTCCTYVYIRVVYKLLKKVLVP